MHRIAQKRKSSSRRSYDESSGNRKIEKKMGCAEAETAKRLTIDELSFQEKESRSTANQLPVRIPELQDKVNSLNDAREFCDPENGKQFWGYPTFPVSLWVF